MRNVKTKFQKELAIWQLKKRNRKDLQVGVGTLLLFPIYRSILAVYRFYGYWRSILKYIPIVKSPKNVLGQTKEVAQIYPLLQEQRDIDVWPIEDDYGHESNSLGLSLASHTSVAHKFEASNTLPLSQVMAEHGACAEQIQV